MKLGFINNWKTILEMHQEAEFSFIEFKAFALPAAVGVHVMLLGIGLALLVYTDEEENGL